MIRRAILRAVLPRPSRDEVDRLARAALVAAENSKGRPAPSWESLHETNRRVYRAVALSVVQALGNG